jgi:hypothetical protein
VDPHGQRQGDEHKRAGEAANYVVSAHTSLGDRG